MTSTSNVRGWKTIDYIGGGYVLQVATRVDVDVQRSYRDNDKINKATVDYKTEQNEWFVSKQDRSYGKDRLDDAYQKHRLVHISELKDINFQQFIRDVEDRGAGIFSVDEDD